MSHHNTVFGQLLTLLPRHELDTEARDHQRGQRLRVMSRWAQFVALGLGQLASRQSLRDIVSNLRAQPAKLYHLGVRTVSRSSLARVNAEQPYTLYEALFGRLLSRCQQRAPGHGFRFRHKLYAVDASTIDLCLAVFPWASFRRTKAAIKLHVGLDQAGHLPSFVPDRRDRLLLISALAIAVLSLLGAAGERIGYDRWLKANTVKRRTHSLFRQGLMLYHHLPNLPEDRVRRLMETFGSMLMEQRV